MNIDSSRLQIFWHGIGGATITDPYHAKSLWSDITLIKDLNIDAVFLDIGSNDLCNSQIPPRRVADKIFTFACRILLDGCKYVIIGEILSRNSNSGFSQRAMATNSLLQQYCAHHDHIKMWNHSRNNFNVRFLQDYVAADGVHVDNDRGMARYYSSIRGAVLQAERCLH